VEVSVTGELRFTRIPIRTQGRGDYARERKVSRSVPEYFTISTEVSEASLAEIEDEEGKASKTGAFTEQINAARDEAIDFLQNLLANTYELEESLEG